MEEATFKAAEEEAGRQINHPFSIAFQELGPMGGWRHGSIFWIVAQTQCIVCRVKLVCKSTFHYQPTPPPAPPCTLTTEGRNNLSPPRYSWHWLLHSSLYLKGSLGGYS